MKAPIFNSTRSTTPAQNVDSGALAWILKNDPVLYQRTQAVRTADDPGPPKLKLPGVCLGGPFRGLRANDDHGRTIRNHDRYRCTGYRNGHHADWGARTGLVLIDIDDLPDTAPPDCIKYLLTHAAEPVVLAWTSARGRGLKVAVLTNPIPATADETRWAWQAARKFMVDLLESAGLHEGIDYKVDPTFSVPQLAILAHDPSPLGRVPDSQSAVAWTPGEPAQRGMTGVTGAAMLQSPDMNVLIPQLPWTAGGRSASLYKLGIACATSGIRFESARPSAEAVAGSCGLIADYGRYGALRHFDRGYWWGNDQSWDAGLGM